MVICNSVKIQHCDFSFKKTVKSEDGCILVLDNEVCGDLWIEVGDEDWIEF